MPQMVQAWVVMVKQGELSGELWWENGAFMLVQAWNDDGYVSFFRFMLVQLWCHWLLQWSWWWRTLRMMMVSDRGIAIKFKKNEAFEWQMVSGAKSWSSYWLGMFPAALSIVTNPRRTIFLDEDIATFCSIWSYMVHNCCTIYSHTHIAWMFYFLPILHTHVSDTSTRIS